MASRGHGGPPLQGDGRLVLRRVGRLLLQQFGSVGAQAVAARQRLDLAADMLTETLVLERQKGADLASAGHAASRLHSSNYANTRTCLCSPDRRSEQRRVGKESVIVCRCRWCADM